MKDVDLSKLQVNRNTTFALQAHARRRLRWWHGALAVAAIGTMAAVTLLRAPLVQTTAVVTAFPSQQYVVQNATGYVVARRKAAVASKGTGRLEWLGVSEGSVVTEGTIVARLESRDVEATLQNAVANTAVAAAGIQSAKAEMDDASMNLDRMKNLYAKHYVSQIMYDDAVTRVARGRAAVASAKASYEAAEANQAFAQNAVEYTRIRAPFDGVVLSTSANVGDIVTPMSSAADSKGAVVVMADMSTLEVDVDVAESAVAGIKVDQPCEIVLDAFPDRHFRGVVSAIVPAVNRSSATVTTKIRLVDVQPGILPDMSARVGFLSRSVALGDEKPVLAVSPQALAQRDGHTVIFRLSKDNHVEAVPVQAGPQLGDVRQVSGNVHSGDVVVVSPPSRLHAGSAVKLAEDH